MEQAIRDFAKQFEYEPKIENEEKLQRFGKYILCGMGGSHLQGDIMQAAVPGFDLSIHQDYGLPKWPEDVLRETLVIASSFSGNTEETISAFEEAMEKGIPLAVIASGGKLIDMAKQNNLPYIQVPNPGIQPRAALGYTFLALAKMLGREDVIKEGRRLVNMLDPEGLEEEGKEVAKHLEGRAPIVYASNRNYGVAYNWKIKFNETGKIPAFYNIIPELNHNEMNGFDVTDTTRELTSKFFFLFLQDAEDHPRVQKRMEVLQKQLHGRGLPIITADLKGNSRLERIFSSLLLADWIAVHLARHYGRDPEQVPMIEEFKKMIG